MSLLTNEAKGLAYASRNQNIRQPFFMNNVKDDQTGKKPDKWQTLCQNWTVECERA